MTNYTPKVGDKVRATLGENVLMGNVVALAERDWADIEFTDTNTIACFFGDGWRFERIQEVPSRFGAVIRRADGELFSLGPGGKYWLTRGGGCNESEATRGGFTVLFDGVDE